MSANQQVLSTVGSAADFYILSPSQISSAADSIVLAPVSTTDVTFIYNNGSNFCAKVGTVNAGSISYGAQATIKTTAFNSLDAVKLSSTQALAAGMDTGNSNKGTAALLDISGSTVTPATPVVFETATTTFVSLSALSSTQAIVVYQNNGTFQPYANILDISGSVVTPATAVSFGAVNNLYMRVAALSATQAIAVMYDQSVPAVKGLILNVSGSTITPATESFQGPSGVTDLWVSALSSTTALMIYKTATIIRGSIKTVSGNTISSGSEYTIYSGSSIVSATVAVVSATSAFICLIDGTTIKVVKISIAGTAITAGSAVSNSETTTPPYYSPICSLTSTTQVIAYRKVTSVDGRAAVISS